VVQLVDAKLVRLDRIAQGGMRVRASAGAASFRRRTRPQKALAKVRQLGRDKPAEKDKVRASTTDPEARVMKMADGGFRPAHNVQFATEVESQVVASVEVKDAGSDMHQLVPMLEQIEKRHAHTPREVLVDGGYGTLDPLVAIRWLSRPGIDIDPRIDPECPLVLPTGSGCSGARPRIRAGNASIALAAMFAACINRATTSTSSAARAPRAATSGPR